MAHLALVICTANGPRGTTGPVRPAGPNSATGDAGVTGATGPAGEQGIPGVGITGPTGGTPYDTGFPVVFHMSQEGVLNVHATVPNTVVSQNTIFWNADFPAVTFPSGSPVVFTYSNPVGFPASTLLTAANDGSLSVTFLTITDQLESIICRPVVQIQ